MRTKTVSHSRKSVKYSQKLTLDNSVNKKPKTKKFFFLNFTLNALPYDTTQLLWRIQNEGQTLKSHVTNSLFVRLFHFSWFPIGSSEPKLNVQVSSVNNTSGLTNKFKVTIQIQMWSPNLDKNDQNREWCNSALRLAFTMLFSFAN